MEFIDTDISDVKILKPKIYGDQRGYFYESFNQKEFDEGIGYSVRFVQDNHSKSTKGVLRGLHYQLPPHPQGKLVRVVYGEVFDVAVDIRRSSPTFGKWVGIILSAENAYQLWIPEGFAHAFLVLSDSAQFLYKTTDFWSQDLERSIAWDDPEIGIIWPSNLQPTLSIKDQNAVRLRQAELF